MTSTSETGHVKNVANFETLIAFCQSYGSAYNPSKDALKIPQLQVLFDEANKKINEVKIAKTSFSNATNDRKNTFADIKPFTTKVINAFMVSGVDKLAIENAKSVNKKIQGSSNKNKKQEGAKEENEITTKNISTSQQSFDRLIDHFANLIEVLEQHPQYTPNENELQVATLQNKLATLKTTNTNLINSYTKYSNTLIDRDQSLYDPLTGLVQMAKEVKGYVKSIFGANSPQYKQVNAVEFKTRGKK